MTSRHTHPARKELEELALFLPPLRVLAEYDPTYKTHVAYCLETGSVISADNCDELRVNIKELLEDEVSFAIEHRNLTNLFSNPAPFDVFAKWQDAVAKGEEVEDIPLDIEDEIPPDEPGGGPRRQTTVIRVVASTA